MDNATAVHADFTFKIVGEAAGAGAVIDADETLTVPAVTAEERT
jgi:hypothetical protein